MKWMKNKKVKRKVIRSKMIVNKSFICIKFRFTFIIYAINKWFALHAFVVNQQTEEQEKRMLVYHSEIHSPELDN